MYCSQLNITCKKKKEKKRREASSFSIEDDCVKYLTKLKYIYTVRRILLALGVGLFFSPLLKTSLQGDHLKMPFNPK